MRKLLCILLVIAVLLTGCKKEEEVPEQEIVVQGTRYLNLNNYTVETPEGTWQILNGGVYLDEDEIEVGDLTPSHMNPTLSIIEDCIYVHSDMGMQRYSLSTKITTPLYYDAMDFSVAGLSSIFYVNNTTLYRAAGVEDYEVVAEQVTKDVFCVYKNLLIFVALDEINTLDLTTESVKFLESVSSPILKMSAANDMLVVTTVEGDIDILL